MDPLAFFFLVSIASVLILAFSSEYLVKGIVLFGEKIGISEYVIGFLVVSLATALPELLSSLQGAFLGDPGIILGTILGSNIFKLPLLGLVIIVGKKIKTHAEDIGSAPIVTLFISLLPLLLIIDGNLTRIDGFILLLAFVLYMMNLWQSHSAMKPKKINVKLSSLIRPMLIFLGCLVALLLSSRFLVHSLTELTTLLGMSSFFIGFLVIGIGASAPELVVQLKAIVHHHQNLAFGNVLGSIVANSTLVLGIVALLFPFSMDFSIIFPSFLFLAIGLFLVLWLMMKEEVNWKHGVFLLVLYFIFLGIEFLM